MLRGHRRAFNLGVYISSASVAQGTDLSWNNPHQSVALRNVPCRVCVRCFQRLALSTVPNNWVYKQGCADTVPPESQSLNEPISQV